MPVPLQLPGQNVHNDSVPSIEGSTFPSLWARAFREFEKADPKLAAKFTTLLNAESSSQDGGQSPAVNSPQKPHTDKSSGASCVNPTVAELAMTTIRKVDDAKNANHGHSAKVRGLLEETIKMVLSASDLIAPAFAFNPYAATAWSAVCFILPLCLVSGKENEAAIQGLYTVSNLMTVYKWKEKVYLPNQPDGDFAQATIRLYAAILKYEATLLVHQQRSRVKRLASNISKTGQWEILISGIKQFDVDCKAITLAADAARAQDWENEQREWRLAQIKEVQNEKMRANIRKLYSKYEEGKDSNPLPQNGTGEWFFRNPGFLHWRNSTSASFLWLKAEPGLGKSVLARHLVENRILTSSQSRMPLICYFFFKKNDSEKDTATKAVCALLHQLYLQKPNLYKYAEVDFENKGEVFLTDLDALWAIFRDSVMDTDNGEIVCILDALDECERASRDKLISNLTKYYQTILPSSLSHLKVLVTSRSLTSISHSFKALQETSSFGLTSGSDEQDSLSQEIEIFITQKVSEIAKDLSLTKRQERLLRSKISAAPNRTYLWLHLVLGLVRKRGTRLDSSITQIFDDLPIEVEQAYDDLLNQIPSWNVEHAKAIFSTILAANRPLTLHELDGALCSIDLEGEDSIKGGFSRSSLGRWDLEDTCGLFVTVVDDRVYLIHQTARDFLTWSTKGSVLSKKRPHDGSSWKGAFRPAENHHKLSVACVSLLKSHVVQENAAVDSLRLRSMSYWWIGFLNYAATHWALHFSLAEVEVHDEKLMSTVLSEVYENEKVFNIWSSIYKGSPLGQSTDFPTNCSPLLWSSYFGHLSILTLELKRTKDFDQRDDCQKSCLVYACEQGHAKVVEILLEAGASTETRDILDSTILSAAAGGGNEGIVRQLIDRGAAINHVDALNLTPFQYAAHRKASGCMRLLKLEQSRTDISVVEILMSEDEAIRSLDPVLQMIQKSHTRAFESGLWISDDEDQLCYSRGALSGTGFSAMFHGILSGLRAYSQHNYSTARSHLLYAISHTRYILQTESPLMLPYFLWIMAKIDHSGIPKLGMALCQHIVSLAGAARRLSGVTTELFSSICRVLRDSHIKAPFLAELFLDQIVKSFRKDLGPYHMQTVYIQHLQLQTRALLHPSEDIISELETMLDEVKAHRDQTSPQYIQLLIDLSQVCFDCRRYKQAEKIGQQIIDKTAELMLKPYGKTGKNLRMQCSGHSVTAESLSSQGRFDQAEGHFRQAIRLARSFPRKSIFSMVDKYETRYADWLRFRGRKEEAMTLISTDNGSVAEETANDNGIYYYFLKRSKQLNDVHHDYETLKHELTGLWPQRLLRVDDMTSHLREEDDTYAKKSRPSYNILSYKWGLWVVQQGDRLDVDGVDWEIPAVDPQRWTVPEMEQILETIAEDTDFVWLDVACVNQSQNNATMEEIRREPEIFVNATKVFVWLVDYPDKDMDKCLNSIAEIAQDLPGKRVDHFDESVILATLEKAVEPLTKLLSCAWFRSHWTLREIIMRRDAILLDRQGCPIPLGCQNDKAATLDLLVFVCQNLLTWLFRQETVAGSDMSEIGQEHRWHTRVDEVKIQLLDLVNTSGPFLLFAYDPLGLRTVTEKLLTVGQKVVDGAASEAYSHGRMIMACTCDESFDRCLACIVGISYKVGDTILVAKSSVLDV